MKEEHCHCLTCLFPLSGSAIMNNAHSALSAISQFFRMLLLAVTLSVLSACDRADPTPDPDPAPPTPQTMETDVLPRVQRAVFFYGPGEAATHQDEGARQKRPRLPQA